MQQNRHSSITTTENHLSPKYNLVYFTVRNNNSTRDQYLNNTVICFACIFCNKVHLPKSDVRTFLILRKESVDFIARDK